jgi:hypothetical protein
MLTWWMTRSMSAPVSRSEPSTKQSRALPSRRVARAIYLLRNERSKMTGGGAVDTVSQAVPSGNDRYKPGLAIVKRWRRKGVAVESAWPVLQSENFTGRLIAEVTHHRDAAAVATDGVVHALVRPHMGDMVGCHSDEAGPTMRNFYRFEDWPYAAHHAVEMVRRGSLVLLKNAWPRAEDQPCAIG